MSQTDPAYNNVLHTGCTAWAAVQARAHRLQPATIRPCVVQVCRLMVFTRVISLITNHLPTPEGWKAEFA